jgi:metallo-beta-lactamase class B
MLSALPCDILMTPHPEASDLLKRLASRDAGHRDALRDPQACKAYARLGEQSMQQRIAAETATAR